LLTQSGDHIPWLGDEIGGIWAKGAIERWLLFLSHALASTSGDEIGGVWAKGPIEG